MPNGKILKNPVKPLPVERTQHGAGVGGFETVRIAIADDDFAAYNVQNVVEQSRPDDPAWQIQTRWWGRLVGFQVGEADLAGVACFVGQVTIQNVGSGADERSGSVSPLHPIVEK